MTKEYELVKASEKSKTVHVAFREAKNKPFTLLCSKKPIGKDWPEFEADMQGLTMVNCKNCLRTDEAAALFDVGCKENVPIFSEQAEKKIEEEQQAVSEQPVIIEQPPKENVPEQTKVIPPKYVTVFSATNRRQKPFFSVLAEDIDKAKEKIVAERKRTCKRKLMWDRWEEDGSTIIRYKVPRSEADKYLASSSASGFEEDIIHDDMSMFIMQGISSISSSLQKLSVMGEAFMSTFLCEKKSDKKIIPIKPIKSKKIIPINIKSKDKKIISL